MILLPTVNPRNKRLLDKGKPAVIHIHILPFPYQSPNYTLCKYKVGDKWENLWGKWNGEQERITCKHCLDYIGFTL